MRSLRGSRYPIWSVRAIVLISLPVVAVVTLLVFWISHSSPYVEFQITLLVVAIILFVFLATGLYRGVRLERPQRDAPRFEPLPTRNALPDGTPVSTDVLDGIGHSLSGVQLPHIDLDLSDGFGGDDVAGCLVSIVAWIVVTIALAFLLWLAAQALWIALFALVVALYWVFYRALRVVFARSRQCRTKWLPSLATSLLYTTLYAGWVFVVIWISRLVWGR
jgi:hypothetical protein